MSTQVEEAEAVVFPKLARGRTFADVTYSVIERPLRSSLVFLLFCASLLAVVLGATWVFSAVFRVEPSEIKLGPTSPEVVFHSTQQHTEEYVVVVNPHGWQDTGIVVHAGDELTISAGGKICLDVSEILKKEQKRNELEKQAAHEQNIKIDDPTEKRVPEDSFTAEQNESLILYRPWNDPDGFDPRPSYRFRPSRYVMPDRPLGALIAAVKPDRFEPKGPDAFVVGTKYLNVASNSGDLWFTVNDVIYKDNPTLYFDDNVGSFWVRVVLKRK